MLPSPAETANTSTHRIVGTAPDDRHHPLHHRGHGGVREVSRAQEREKERDDRAEKRGKHAQTKCHEQLI